MSVSFSIFIEVQTRHFSSHSGNFFVVEQKLSARVAGKWLVQDPLTSYKDYSYSRVIRKTGAGYRILVDLYLNGTFLRRDVITTR